MPKIPDRMHERSMTNIAVLVLSAVFIAAVAAGCSTPRTVSHQPPVSEISDKIAQAVDLSAMKAGDSSKLQKLYGINADKLDGFALYTAPSNVKADELVVLKVKDAGDVDAIKDNIAKKVDSQAASFKDYLPEQYYLIEQHVLKSSGNYVLLAISKDTAGIEAAFDDSLK